MVLLSRPKISGKLEALVEKLGPPRLMNAFPKPLQRRFLQQIVINRDPELIIRKNIRNLGVLSPKWATISCLYHIVSFQSSGTIRSCKD